MKDFHWRQGRWQRVGGPITCFGWGPPTPPSSLFTFSWFLNKAPSGLIFLKGPFPVPISPPPTPLFQCTQNFKKFSFTFCKIMQNFCNNSKPLWSSFSSSSISLFFDFRLYSQPALKKDVIMHLVQIGCFQPIKPLHNEQYYHQIIVKIIACFKT